MNCLVALNQKIVRLAHNRDFMPAYEEILSLTVEMKRLTHAVHPDMCDRDFPKALLKLHREDDAIAFIRYWLKWRPRGRGNLRDPLILLSSKGDWPFPVEKDCPLHDITDELRSCQFQEGDRMNGDEMGVPAPFCLVALVIKLRHICVHRNRMDQATSFRSAAGGLPQDVITTVVNFLTGDKAAALYAEQSLHADHLLDLIDEWCPNILPGSLNRSVMPRPRVGKDKVDDDRAFDVGGFIMTFGCRAPVVELYKDIVGRRYGLFMIKIPEELRGRRE